MTASTPPNSDPTARTTREDDATSSLTRRGFVGGALATGAAAALPAAADARTRHRAKPKPRRPVKAPLKADVVVIGAGLAGLSAARALKAAGRSVLVLEARNRVGGRCYSRSLGPGASDVANMGATFVGPTQQQVLGLMSELGIAKFPVYADGSLLYYQNGQAKRYTGTIPPDSDPVAVAELGVKILPAIDQMAATVPLDAPYNAPNAPTWDAMTVETWSEQNITSADARALFALAVEAILSVEPRDISMLYFLFYVHSAGSTEVLIANAGQGGAQDFRVSGGTQGMAEAVARQLGRGRVLLNQPVRRIVQHANKVTVYTDHTSVTARRAIVAIPPHLAGRIFYEPGMPAVREQLTQRMPIGSLIKTIAVYDTPFWRAQGLNGQVTSDTGPVKVMFDASPASGTPGVLLGFIDGDDARALDDASDADRATAALGSYANYFGEQARGPRMYFDEVWAREPYTGGCPVGVTPPGVLTEYGSALRAPVGRIHWAGTETATIWNGYMDGAIQSGKRAAAEAIATP